MVNMMNWFLPAPVTGMGQVSPGSAVSVQTWPGASQVSVTGPDQQKVNVGPPFPVIPYTNTNNVGVYQVSQTVRGQKLNGIFTVNLFSPTQSNLAPAHTLPINHSVNFTGSKNTVSHQLREIWPWIAAILLLILCVEWWLFSRNYQLQSKIRKGGSLHGDMGRKGKQQSTNKLIAQLQRHSPDWDRLRRRALKYRKRVRSRLKQHAKGERHVNI
jgi:Ca-activated chloride channel homolog